MLVEGYVERFYAVAVFDLNRAFYHGAKLDVVFHLLNRRFARLQALERACAYLNVRAHDAHRGTRDKLALFDAAAEERLRALGAKHLKHFRRARNHFVALARTALLNLSTKPLGEFIDDVEDADLHILALS